MRRGIAGLTAGAAMVYSAAAIMVSTDSTCDQQCGNVLDATTPADIVCNQNDYTSAAGVVFENCLNCEISSTAYDTSTNQSDQQWALYNSRYALSECLFGQPGNNDAYLGGTPCVTSRACGPFETALQNGNFSTDPSFGAYDYCADWQDDDFYTGCINCLLAEDDDYLANMLVLLQVGCDQRPAPGSTVAVSGSLFSTTLLTEASPSPTSTWTNPTDTGPLSLGAKVGIAIGALCLLLAAAGVFIVCNGRRRRRAFLRKLEMRQKDAGSGWPHPSYADRGQGGGSHGIMSTRGPDMNETPLSQKPLRGWDDSPQSATASEPSSYARYFSPYASQQTSPVNGATQMHAHQWPQEFHDEHTYGAGFPSSSFTAAAEHPMPDHSFPSAAQEKTAMDQHAAAMAAGTANAPLHIGLALGGDEPSLRSKLSGVSSAQQEEEADGGGEAYELHEVSSSAGGSSAGGMNHSAGGVVAGSSQSFRNRVARENRTPVLQHPGYGRYSPERELPPPPPPPVHSIMDEGNRI